ncbi:thioredoxin-like protein [Scenedesmus sp. NREL 46B-D3]|nr:thioredoxin-like protein [Scenedesmus sp. NREL 46B-D3]
MAQPVRAAAVADSSSAGAAAAVSTPTSSSDAAGLLELDKDSFQAYLDAAGDKVVVVDFFTDWCGPCKLIYPELVKLSAELAPAATIAKFNCNQNNKELAKALGIKVAPTFHVYKRGLKVADMTGAKVGKLRELVTKHLATDDAQQN